MIRVWAGATVLVGFTLGCERSIDSAAQQPSQEEAAATAPALARTLPWRTAALTAAETPTHLEYDANGRLTRTTDPRGIQTDLRYGADGAVSEIEGPPAIAGGPRPLVRFGTDRLGAVTSFTDPRGLTTSSTSDGLDNRPDMASPDAGASTVTYDEAGNVKTRLDARGKLSTYAYDALGRLTSVTYSSGTASAYTYDVDPNGTASGVGKLTKITDESGQTTFSYDTMGRLAKKVQTVGSGTTALVFPVSYEYGVSGASLGLLTAIVYPSGNKVWYTHNAAGQVSGIHYHATNANGIGTNATTSTTLLTDITYSPDGTPTAWRWGNDTAGAPNAYARTLDETGRVVGYPLGTATAKGLARTVSYDTGGRVTAMTHSGTGTGTFAPAAFDQTYEVDDLGRLTGFASSATNQEYAYDLSGNRTEATYVASTFTHVLAAASNWLLSTTGPAPAKTNAFDAAGNLTSDGTVAFAYSDRGRMKSATKAGSVVNYYYNALGQRVRKSGPTSLVAGGTNYFVYDEAGHLLGEYYQYAQPMQETVYLGDMPVAVLKQTLTRGTAIQVDNNTTGKFTVVGSWPTATTLTTKLGSNYQTHVGTTTTTDSFTWKPSVAAAGRYWVEVRSPAASDRSTVAPYTMVGSDGTTTATANQTANAGIWVTLALKSYAAGTASIVLKATTKPVFADGARIVPVTVATSASYIFADHLNAARVITRTTDNQIVWRWDNADPFGAALPNENPSGFGAFGYNGRFPGQVYDKESGLHHNFLRDYDPVTGRYVESDPIGLLGGVNSYAYASNNPLVFSDPTGTNPVDDTLEQFYRSETHEATLGAFFRSQREAINRQVASADAQAKRGATKAWGILRDSRNALDAQLAAGKISPEKYQECQNVLAGAERFVYARDQIAEDIRGRFGTFLPPAVARAAARPVIAAWSVALGAADPAWKFISPSSGRSQPTLDSFVYSVVGGIAGSM